MFSVSIFAVTQAQTLDFNKHKVNYKFSYESLSMANEPNIGFVGIGADLFIFKTVPNLYFTLNSYSGITGERPGLITFGLGLGYQQPLFKSPMAIDFGIFAGGGGGGGAADGGGLITRGHLNLVYNFKHFSLFGGYSRLDFPTGEMSGNNFNFGLSLNSFFDTASHSTNSSENSTSSEGLFFPSRFRVGFVGMRYVNFQKGPFPVNSSQKAGDIQLLGMELNQFFSKKLYAALKLGGAVTGGVDGYMQHLVGLGFEQPLGTENFILDAQVLGGPSGGGGIDSGGGLTFQGSLGFRVHLGNQIQLKAGVGQTFSPEGNFKGNFAEVGLSKSFNFLTPTTSVSNYTLGADEVLHGFGLNISNRVYVSPKKLDKNDKLYDSYFNLLGFKLSKDFGKHWKGIGATYWAYQGSYGAYAEGWLGLQYHLPLSQRWNFYAQLMGGAAGGGGIDLGSGLTADYGLGIEHNLNENWSLNLSGGQMRGLKGNFNPSYLELGVKYSFMRLAKKN